jgi:hypothetical protein
MKFILTFVALVPLLGPLHAQTVAGDGAAAVAANLEHSAPLPDAPAPEFDVAAQSRAQTPSLQNSAEPEQTKRILGIVPNFRSVSADVILPPETAKEKFETGSQDSFDYSSFIFVGMLAGISQATDSYPVFRQGSAGYGRYYWHTFADQTDENLWVESFLPAALHEDSRYYTLGQGGFLKRVGYALSRAVVTRNDNGDPTFNAAEVVGADAAAGISSAYYPGQYRTWTKTGQRWLTSVVLDSATFAAKEFWPDIHHALRHGRE